MFLQEMDAATFREFRSHQCHIGVVSGVYPDVLSSYNHMFQQRNLLFCSTASYMHTWFKFSYLYFHFYWHLYIQHHSKLPACVLKSLFVLI